MQPHYSPDFPLGYNANRKSPQIPYYCSWDELVSFTRTGNVTDISSTQYYIPEEKAEKPLFTFKGDFGAHRCNSNFKGERSPYIGIDIDIDEKASGLSKYALTDEQKVKTDADINKLLDELTHGKFDFFFCKRTSSGCGLHIIIKLVDVPDGKFNFYEKEIFSLLEQALEQISPVLNYRYIVDRAMLNTSQALHINYDPNVIYNPGRTTSATMYKITPEYGEDKDEDVHPVRLPHELDRIMFLRFVRFCSQKRIRLEYVDLFRLSLIFFQLWPEATPAEFMEMCVGLNEERARVKHIARLQFFRTDYKKIRDTLKKPYQGNKISVDSLYYIMAGHGYQYEPDMVLHFNNYLSTIKENIYDAFQNNETILLEAPTGGGKTYLIFEYLKEQARLNPRKNFVVALPYIGMVDQFCKENSDAEFEIKALVGDMTTIPNTMVEVTEINARKPQLTYTLFNVADGGDIQIEETEPIIQASTRKKKKKSKVKKKVKKGLECVPVFDIPSLMVKRKNLWVTTYDSAVRIKSIHTIVIDEAHNLIKQLGYRSEAIENLCNLRCNKRILVTATPDVLLPATEKYYYVKCIKDDKKKPKLTVERVKGSLLMAAKNNIRITASSLTFWNDKQKCEKLRNELLTDGIKAEIYSRDTRTKPHQALLKSEGILSTHSIATSYISEGINVYNEKVDRINIIGDYDIDSIRQASARPRKAESEIRLIIQDSEYNPGTWVLLRDRQYIREVSRLMQVAEKLTGIRKSLQQSNNDDSNLFNAFEDDERFLWWNGWLGVYEVNNNRVKAKINDWYKHWFFHKKREMWLRQLGEHFTVEEKVVLTDYQEKDSKRIPPLFEPFENAGHEMIMDFHAFKKKTRDKRYKKEKYSPEMLNWSRANNQIEQTTDWVKWTERYLKMLAYKSVDFDIIKSGQKFCRWQRKADMNVSVNEPLDMERDSAKEVYIAQTNKAVVKYLLGLDYKQNSITMEHLYLMVEAYIKQAGLKPIKMKIRTYISVLKDTTITIKLRYKRSTGERYVKEVLSLSPTYTSGKMERAAKEAARNLETAERYADL
jgi:hypothetical protein